MKTLNLLKQLLPKDRSDTLTVLAGYFTLILGVFLAVQYFTGINPPEGSPVLSMPPAIGLGLIQVTFCAVTLGTIFALTKYKKLWLSRLVPFIISAIFLTEIFMNGGWRGF
jgi:hypothetical protein